MLIDYLLEFCVFAEYLNFTKAAAALYMTQSTLSKHMAALERELGCPLIERDKESISLTPVGEAILEDAMRVKYDYEKLTAHVSDLKSHAPYSITVMEFDTYRPMRDIMATTIRNLHKRNRVFQADFKQVKHHSPIQDIRNGKADICYTALAPDESTDDLAIQWLYDEPVFAVVSKHHKLANRETISIRELDGELWHMPASDAFSDSYHLIRHLVEMHGVQMRYVPEPWMRSGDFFNYSFDEGVFLGSASAIQKDSPVTSLVRYSVLRLEESDIVTPCNVIWLKGNFNPAIPIFIEEIANVASSIDVAKYWES